MPAVSLPKESTPSRRRSFIVLPIEGIESEVFTVKTPVSTTPTAEDASDSTDDSYEVNPAGDPKKVIRIPAPKPGRKPFSSVPV